jgi:phage tail sheath protein FI
MSFQVSPGVQVIETDLTNIIPAVSTSIGGYAGSFEWGPVEEITLVGSEKELANKFGLPKDGTAESFFTAASYLKYSTALKVVRTNDGTSPTYSKNAAVGTALTIKNGTAYETASLTTAGEFVAKYPGTLGNSIGVAVCYANAAEFATWDWKSAFSSEPGTSSFAASRGASNDEIHVVVYDIDGKWTGAADTILEKFEYVSLAADAIKEDGSSNYYKNVLNNTSNYIWWANHAAEVSDAGAVASSGLVYTADLDATGSTDPYTYDYALVGGTKVAATAANITTALDLFANAEEVDVSLLFAGADTGSATTIAAALIAIAEARKDLVAFVSPPLEKTVNNATPLASVLAWANTVTSTSYAVVDSSAVKVYDKYNDVYRWVPAAGFIAGLCANADEVADAWFSPAGLNRGQLLGIAKLAYNPKQADRDELYKARVNPLVSFPGQGTVLYGDKTLLAKPSAFDRINVRRLFITLEKAIATAAKFQLFEFNDEFTRAQFLNIVEPFLRDVQGRRGLTDFFVVCDETNNTAAVIDRNEFRADIYVKPARSINFITLNFVATRTGVEFAEIIGQANITPNA